MLLQTSRKGSNITVWLAAVAGDASQATPLCHASVCIVWTTNHPSCILNTYHMYHDLRFALAVAMLLNRSMFVSWILHAVSTEHHKRFYSQLKPQPQMAESVICVRRFHVQSGTRMSDLVRLVDRMRWSWGVMVS